MGYQFVPEAFRRPWQNGGTARLLFQQREARRYSACPSQKQGQQYSFQGR